jgi:UDP-N-acetylglucosamine 4-epimerase
MQAKSTVLITGGAGFIGSNLCEYFLSKAISDLFW